ncbi:uncharacterized protein RMCC_5558 [Mycolicibacterium canariasense]|uniref:Uncharacterized protein n=2 Tax=Mycolicibacterium canariasense TaxID=228230 RepID=A0A100WID0_MYCCR|nr:hypothetical protein [Mycolicibacterium canariasense]MCV7211161.1 hypothetical protein [Mycolicibacterium canariasense]GAS98593.1 uncharacterized protein RMCC_5558 [Mycolicibacterium canariasense]
MPERAADDTHEKSSERGESTHEDSALRPPQTQEESPLGKETPTSGLVLPSWYDNSHLEAAFASAPAPGKRWTRWYDLPYVVLRWCAGAGRRHLLPRWMHLRVVKLINLIHLFNTHDRHKAWSRDDPRHNVTVPDAEHVTVPTLWVVELFPPSVAAELRRVVKTFDAGIRVLGDSPAETVLSESRAGQGYSWFRLASIKAPHSSAIVPESRTRRLPDPFWLVELTALQLGTGLTAVVAQFHLTESASTDLDREWHRDHEPRIRRQGRRLTTEDREWSAYSHTQQVRRHTHDLARQWVSRHCPGVFAAAREPQPLMDLLIVEEHKLGQRPPRANASALRALGLTTHHYLIASPDVPQLAVNRADPGLCPSLGTSRSWALWGNRTEVAQARTDLSMYGGEADTPRAIGRAVSDDIRDFLIALSVTEMIDTLQSQYAKVRDTARRQPDSFSTRYLKVLRRTLLTLSIDVASCKVDVPAWWERAVRDIARFGFFYLNHHSSDGVPDEELELEFDVTERLRAGHTADLAVLAEADRTIRDILATVASLGAARDTHRVGLLALLVAGLSLIIATVTLLFTAPGTGSIADHIWHWLELAP